MNDLETEGTKVSNIKEWEEADVAKPFDEQTESFRKSTSSNWSDMMKVAPAFLVKLEENLAFTATLLSIVGYVVIAAFGQMDSLKKYFQYLLFLLFTFCIYKALKTEYFPKWYKKIKINKILLFFLIVFFLIIVGQNLNNIVAFLNSIVSVVSK